MWLGKAARTGALSGVRRAANTVASHHDAASGCEAGVRVAVQSSLDALSVNVAGLLGGTFYLQGLVVDPATNNLGLIVTNAAEATVGT